MTEIGDDAFMETTNLRKVDLSHTRIKKVGEHAFQSSGIEEITFPPTLEEMGKYALSQTPNLNEVDLLNTGIHQLNKGMFWKSGIHKLRFPMCLEKVQPMIFKESMIDYLDMSECKRGIIGYGYYYGRLCVESGLTNEGYREFIRRHDVKCIKPGYQSECTYVWPADKKEKAEEQGKSVKETLPKKTYRIVKNPGTAKKPDDYIPGG